MFDLGDTVPLTFEVRTTAGVLTNAATVTLTVTRPDGTTETPTVTNPPAVPGEYGVDYLPTTAGTYRWRLVSTAPDTAITGSFDVRPALTRGIVSLEATKRHLNKDPADTTDDEELREIIEATTEMIESIRGKVMVRRQFVEEVTIRPWARGYALLKSPVQELTSVEAIDGSTTWDVADLHVDENGVVTVQDGPMFCGLMRFTYVAGYEVLPANFVHAAKIIIAHLWETQRPSLTSERYGTPRPFAQQDASVTPIGAGFAIPNRALELLGVRGPLVA